MDWYEELLEEYRIDGRNDAEQGIYEPPYALCQECPDPNDQDANEAYKHGFMQRRAELGDKFKWQ